MRFFLLFVIVLAALTLVCSGASSIATPRDRSAYMPTTRQDVYCLQGRIWGYPGNCQFSSYSQCMATASGTDAYCGINPVYAFERRRSQSR
ncbi:DUF3551 domain-containing protein [Bradyrhizobium sp. CIAT3101]|uniref:DUF3551 domain-containing protein n=1 Tax=Bradyrhizobium sp. CIAT3101 TaxID=439387 RepID=UPI0024B0942E|nr:DUF3551 domain-containing protein [Bradyrhizobium sp. CIAT3101]WFU80376.1 DUF3551 domain-containing protein [Bradyrhizobium sp. CIAT3101]